MALPFHVSVVLLPMVPYSGITAPKKGTAKSAIPGGWDREFTACRESKPSSGKKGQPPGVFASLYLEGTGVLIQLKTSRSAQRTKVAEAGPCISPSHYDTCKDIPS